MTEASMHSVNIRKAMGSNPQKWFVSIEMEACSFQHATRLLAAIQSMVETDSATVEVPADEPAPEVVEAVTDTIAQHVENIVSDAHAELVASLEADPEPEPAEVGAAPEPAPKAKRKPRKRKAAPEVVEAEVVEAEVVEAEVVEVAPVEVERQGLIDEAVASVGENFGASADHTEADDEKVRAIANETRLRPVLFEIKAQFEPEGMDAFVEVATRIRPEVPVLARISEDQFDKRIRKTVEILRIC